MRYVILGCMLAMALACFPSKAHASSPKCGGYASVGGCPAGRALPAAVPARILELASELAPAYARRRGEASGCGIGLEQLEEWLKQPRSGIGQ
jgi:hypothetical protein